MASVRSSKVSEQSRGGDGSSPHWSLDNLNPLKSHFSLPFPGTLSHTLSELTEFEPNECRGQRGVDLDLGVERALLVETAATAGKEMLRRISAMVAGF